MKRSSPSRALAVALACLVAVAVSACTPDRPEVTPDQPPVSAPTARSDVFVYADPAGIMAELTLGSATLSIENTTGGILARPGVYVLDARDGRRVAWTVVDAEPIPDGATAEFVVRRPASPEDKHIGLAALLFGGEDHGAFVPPDPAQEAV